MITATATTHELHSRSGDGLNVRLMWRAADDYLFVSVVDRKQGEEFCVEVLDHTRALDVFNHPFAYATPAGAVDAAPAPAPVIAPEPGFAGLT